MARRLCLFIIVLLGISFVIPEIPILRGLAGVEAVDAREVQRKRKNLFQLLFKQRRKKKTRTPNVSRRNLRELPGVNSSRRIQNANTPRTLKRRAPPPKPKVVVVKNENAPKLLVIGDFLGGGVADGLQRLYAENPNIVVVNKAKANSGIVRDDVIDWVNVLPEMIAEIKPAAIVSMVGMNDRQQMRLSTGRVSKLSEEWLAEYNSRVANILSASATANIPLVWVGLPPVRSGKMNSDYLVFNEIYRSKAEAGGASFVDVWDGFTNAEGKFVSAGPDINGQIVRLRGSKGINMTRAGRAKLAFFVDKELKRLGIVSDDPGFEFASLGTINLGNAQPQVPDYDPVGTGKTVIIPLGSPVSDGGNVLEGEKDFLKADEKKNSVSFALVEEGIALQPRAGRIDAGWGVPKIAVAKDETKDAAKDGAKEETTVKPDEATEDPKKTSDAGASTGAVALPKVTNVQGGTSSTPISLSVQN